MSFTRKISLGLAAGVAAGLFLGEYAAPLKIVADGFVRLLQMTVLPYVTVSMIRGIGSLDPADARRLFLRVGGLTLALWGLTLTAAFAMPLTFPAYESASFFSTTLVEERPPMDFLALYIPSNPFYSLANNVVPAVVLFSALLGVALMGVERKERLMDMLDVIERGLARANRLVSRAITPFGLFAIAAFTAGTLDFGQVARLRVFQIGYAALATLLALVVFPGLVACLTPIGYRRVLRSMRDAFITAFAAGDLFIVLPTLIDRSKELLAEEGGLSAEEADAADVVVPAFYNFPHASKLLTLSFVLFAAWYSETVLPPSGYPALAAAGVASLFGSTMVAMPFLLDFARVPADTFHLFQATSPLNSRFGTLAGASHMVVLALAGSYALHGRLRLSAPALIRFGALTAGMFAATIGGLALLQGSLGTGSYAGARVASGMGPLRKPLAEAKVLGALPEANAESSPLLEAVRARGRLRVGFVDGQHPYSYFNASGELVGLDVEMAHALARELGVGLELAPVPRERIAETLDAGSVDVVMAGVAVTTQRASRMTFSAPYLDETLALVVPDHRRVDFSDAAWIRARPGLRLGVPDLPGLGDLVAREFPGALLVPLPLSDTAALFEGRGPDVDAVVLTAERGSFLTLLHPAYSVAVPRPLQIRMPLAYPVARRDLEAARFLSTWIDLKKKDGTVEALYDHWILGRDAEARAPRWSILRDVLGWGG